MNITITKLPKELDLDAIVESRMIETYKRCPYCYDRLFDEYCTHGYTTEQADKFTNSHISVSTYYLRNYKGFLIIKPLQNDKSGLFKMKKKYKWKRIKYCCSNCGMEWESPEYPVGLSADKETRQTIFDNYIKAKGADINTFLIGCVNSAKKV